MKHSARRPRALLVLAALALFVLVPVAAQADTAFYQSPIFGITTSGATVLVAESGEGIVRGNGPGAGQLVAALPGINDVAVRTGGGYWAITSAGEGEQKVYRVSAGGQSTEVADLGAFEAKHNPHPDFVDSNPFDVADAGGGSAVVADAAGNSLLLVPDKGNPKANVSSKVKVIATLPNEPVSTANVKSLFGCEEGGPPDICGLPPMIPAEPVATSVAVGPDGAYYVGELKGFPSPTGESRVWRIEPDARNARCGHSPKCSVVLDGFTSIIDLAFGPDGRLNVAQIEDNSWFAMELAFETEDFSLMAGGSVHACNLATKACETLVQHQPILTAIAYSGEVLWGATWALAPGMAEVAPLPLLP